MVSVGGDTGQQREKSRESAFMRHKNIVFDGGVPIFFPFSTRAKYNEMIKMELGETC